jgi:hypothetical protein
MLAQVTPTGRVLWDGTLRSAPSDGRFVPERPAKPGRQVKNWFRTVLELGDAVPTM